MGEKGWSCFFVIMLVMLEVVDCRMVGRSGGDS